MNNNDNNFTKQTKNKCNSVDSSLQSACDSCCSECKCDDCQCEGCSINNNNNNNRNNSNNNAEIILNCRCHENRKELQLFPIKLWMVFHMCVIIDPVHSCDDIKIYNKIFSFGKIIGLKDESIHYIINLFKQEKRVLEMLELVM